MTTENTIENAAKETRKVGRFRQVMATLWLLAGLLLLPEIAMANPIEDAVSWVQDLLTNGIARSVAIIAIAILGYMAFLGRITGALAGQFIAGIVLVFGGAAIVDLISAAVS